jgi:hypothetical protein
MNSMLSGALSLVAAAGLAGRAGQSEPPSMQGPTGQPPQSVTRPNGTTFGGASSRQASDLAQIIVDANNNNLRDDQQLQGTESENLQTSQQALHMIEQLSNEQGGVSVDLLHGFGRFMLQNFISLPST